jgi:hypothetical protein
MLMDATDRACIRAEEQMSSGSWRTPDPDETEKGDTASHCLVCETPLVPLPVRLPSGKIALRNPTKGQQVCRPCNQKGWRARPCVGCGGPTKTWAWSSKARKLSTRGLCDECRAKYHRETPTSGNERARYMVTA